MRLHSGFCREIQHILREKCLGTGVGSSREELLCKESQVSPLTEGQQQHLMEGLRPRVVLPAPHQSIDPPDLCVSHSLTLLYQFTTDVWSLDNI